MPFNIPAERSRRSGRAIILRAGGLGERGGGAARAAGGLRDGRPRLGICYGQQAMCAQLGGRVAASTIASSAAPSSRSPAICALLARSLAQGQQGAGLDDHGDRVEALPPGFRVVAVSDGAPFSIVADDISASTAPCSHPRSSTPRMGGAAAQLHPWRCRLPRRLDDGRLPRQAIMRAQPSRQGQGDLRPLRRRR